MKLLGTFCLDYSSIISVEINIFLFSETVTKTAKGPKRSSFFMGGFSDEGKVIFILKLFESYRFQT